MSAPIPRNSPSLAALAPLAWLPVLLAALVVFWVATQRRIQRVEAVTNLPTWSVDAPQRAAGSGTGFEKGQRRLIVPGHHNPSFVWIMEAQLSAAEGRLRLRHIDYDARPDGREIRRTAPYRWWLIAVGWLHGTINGEPLGYAIERGALYADPLLLSLLLVLGTIYTARYVGSIPAIGFAVGVIALFPLSANFQPGAPDPHSLAWVLALGSVLPLVAALARSGSDAATNHGDRRWAHFVGAGVFGGLGLWNDATTQMPVLLAVFFGGLGCEFIREHRPRSARSRGAASGTVLPGTASTTPTAATAHGRGGGQPGPAPSHWPAWAAAGALVTLAASLFEFAPDHFSWSLDSVNPIHALAWWGLGEMLHAAGSWQRLGRNAVNRRFLARLAVAGAVVALWLAVRHRTGSGALLATDVYAHVLANLPGGEFARSFGDWMQQAGGGGSKWATLLPGAFLIALPLWILFGRIDAESRGRLAFVAIAAGFVVILALQQLRWWSLFDVLVLVILAAILARSGLRESRSWFKLGGALLLVLPGLVAGFPPPVGKLNQQDLSPLEAQALIERDFSYWLVKRAGPEPTVVFSTPFFCSAAAYYGGFDVVVSTDGENEIGFQTSVRIASASSVQEAMVLLQSRGVTHLVLPLWDPMLDQLVRIGRSLPDGEPLPHQALVVALREWDVPLWLRPMDYLIPNEPPFQPFQLECFAVQPEQEPDLGLSRLTDLFLDRGQTQMAQAMRDVLKSYPRSVSALGAIAGVDLALGDGARVRETLESLIPSLSRRSARDLPADRRIRLAALLARTRRGDLAREQLQACFAKLDSGTLRTLPPGSVVNLVALSRSLDVSFPDPDLEKLALELIPPMVRSSLDRENR